MTTILHCSAAMYTEAGHVLNVGDEGLTRALGARIVEDLGCDVVRAVHRRAAAPALEPGQTDARPLRALVGKVRSVDAVVVGGGTLLQADPGLLRWQLLLATVARAYGRPFLISHVGAENLRGAYGAVARAIVSQASSVSVRDERSQRELLRATGVRAALTGDAMFLATDVPLRATGPRSARSGIAVNLKPGYGTELAGRLAEAVIASTEPDEEVLLAPFDRRGEWDGASLRAFESALGTTRPCRWISADRTPEEVMGELAAVRIAVGVRLHFQIYAALAGAAVCGLGREPKALAYAAETGTTTVDAGASADELRRAISAAAPLASPVLDELTSRAEDGIRLIGATLGLR